MSFFFRQALLLVLVIYPCIALADDQETKDRLTFIQTNLSEESHRANIWLKSWEISMGAITAGQLGAIPFISDKDDRTDLYIGAGATVFGLGLLVLMPPTVIRENKEMQERIALATTPEGRQALLPVAEENFFREAKRERAARGLIAHAGNVVFNAGMGLAIGFGYDRWDSAAISAGSGILLGELLLLTQPHRLSKSVENYRAGQWKASPTSSKLSWELAPVVSTKQTYGLRFALSF